MSIQNGISHATKIDTVASSLRHAVDLLAERAKSTSAPLADRAKQAITEHPLAAVGIAVGVGYLIVRLARRGKS